MAVLLNGVMVSREAGSLMPSLLLDEVRMSNCTMNVIKLDAGDQKIVKDDAGVHKTPILPNPSNLPLIHNGAWSLETEFYANFNGDLEAGPVSFYGKTIDGIAVRRSSNRDNFTKWEDIKIFGVNPEYDNQNPDKMMSFSDKTPESGIWYSYAIQPMSGVERGSLFRAKTRALISEDMFLVGDGGKQLKLRYDASVSAIKKVVKESRVETLGSKYPFISRNGNVNYQEFSLSGLITHFMDDTKDFAPRAELFVDDEFKDDIVDMTADYNALYRAYGLNDYNNDTLEREFRNKVYEFLNDGKPKLFKSPKYGNILVRLLDVNLSPRQDVKGGMVCNFSCTAVEIDEVTVDNLEKYNIQKR